MSAGDEGYADAAARARAESRWLFVQVIDDLSPACRAQILTTWSDADVLEWVEANAVSVRIDARLQPEAARALGVDLASVPTVILLRDDHERLRVTGRPGAEELLKKLEAADVREDNLEIARKMYKDPTDVIARSSLARELVRAGLLDEAFEHVDWMRSNVAHHDQDRKGVSLFLMAWEIREVCDRIPAARARFRELRDQACAVADGWTDDETRLDARVDWIALNEALGDDERTLAWFDTIPLEGRRRLTKMMTIRLLPMLFERRRWADAGPLIDDPLDDLTLMAYFPEGPQFIQRAEAVYRSLLAAGRGADAEAVKEKALSLNASPRMKKALS